MEEPTSLLLVKNEKRISGCICMLWCLGTGGMQGEHTVGTGQERKLAKKEIIIK